MWKTTPTKGTQNLVFTNNSQTILIVFYHLYFNAFKPGTDLEQNSRYSSDDSRSMSKKLLSLPKEDWGDVQINWLLQDGKPVSYKVEETILEVVLNKPIKSGESSVLEMEFLHKLLRWLGGLEKTAKTMLLFQCLSGT